MYLCVYIYMLLPLEVLRPLMYSPISVMDTRTLIKISPGIIIIHHWSDSSASCDNDIRLHHDTSDIGSPSPIKLSVDSTIIAEPTLLTAMNIIDEK